MSEDIGILEEIDESLRVEKLEAFWRQYGLWFIAGCAAIVLSTAGHVLWKNHEHRVNTKTTALLLRAESYDAAGRHEEAAAMLEKATKGSRGLLALAKLERAGYLLEDGKKDQAKDLYWQIADGNADKGLRDFALLQAEALGGKQKINDDSTPLHGLRDEFSALSLLKEGHTKEAREILEGLLLERTLPSSQRQRISDLVDSLGSGEHP